MFCFSNSSVFNIISPTTRPAVSFASPVLQQCPTTQNTQITQGHWSNTATGGTWDSGNQRKSALYQVE